MRGLLVAGLALLTLSPAFADEQVLYHFPSYFSFAQGDLVRDDSGNLYGVTLRDGANGQGTVFRYSPDGQYTVLHDFAGGSDGAWPTAGLIRDADGNLYGATLYGGPSNQGTVFKVAPDGTESVLYAFKGGSDGITPAGRLMRDARGNLYGTTMHGGNFSDDGVFSYGTVFRISPSGRIKTIYAFQSSNDAAVPAAGVISDSKGNLYGTTINGGPAGMGAVPIHGNHLRRDRLRQLHGIAARSNAAAARRGIRYRRRRAWRSQDPACRTESRPRRTGARHD